MTRNLSPSKLACALALLTAPAASNASGFAVPEISIAGLGLANALVANTDEVGAIAYNPAIAALQTGNSVSGGLMLVAPSLEVTTATGSHESQGEDLVPIPMGQLAHKWNESTTLVIGVNAPFGLETSWDPNAPVFPSFSGVFDVLHPTDSKVALLDIGGSAAYRVNEHLAIAAGVDLYWATEVLFSAALVESEGDGIGWGWNASAVYEKGPLALGLAYRSAATVDIQGSSTFPLSGGVSAAANADLPIPSRLQAGIRYRFTDRLAAEFDITRTGWSDFDTLLIDNAINPVESVNNWDDANAYRLGVSYQLDGRTRLRFGYSYDETPQPREWFSARVPDNDRHLFSVGLNRDLGHGLELDAGYMYVEFKDYSHRGTAWLPPGEPNGTSAYDGDYESSVHLLGIGATKRF